MKKQLVSLYPYFVYGYKQVTCDMGLLVTDLILATAIPYLVQCILWFSIYGTSPTLPIGYSHQQILFYYAYIIALGRLNNGYDIVSYLSYKVHDGHLEGHLLRPLSFPLQRMADFLGGSIVYLFPVGLVVLGYTWLVENIFVEMSFVYMVGYMIVFFLAQILCFCLSFLIALFTFVLVKPDFLLMLLVLLQSFLGGLYLPPTLWPSKIQWLMCYNPFRYVTAAPAELLVHIDSYALIEAACFTTLYIIAAALCIHIVWFKLRKRYKSVGG